MGPVLLGRRVLALTMPVLTEIVPTTLVMSLQTLSLVVVIILLLATGRVLELAEVVPRAFI